MLSGSILGATKILARACTIEWLARHLGLLSPDRDFGTVLDPLMVKALSSDLVSTTTGCRCSHWSGLPQNYCPKDGWGRGPGRKSISSFAMNGSAPSKLTHQRCSGIDRKRRVFMICTAKRGCRSPSPVWLFAATKRHAGSGGEDDLPRLARRFIKQQPGKNKLRCLGVP